MCESVPGYVCVCLCSLFVRMIVFEYACVRVYVLVCDFFCVCVCK